MAIAVDASTVLGRIAEVAGAKNDAALARALRVSPQSVHSWRTRGTVPFEATVKFAAEEGVSLDYLLLGRVEDSALPELMAEIGSWVEVYCRDGTAAAPVADSIGKNRRLFAHYCGIIYNRIIATARPGTNPFDYVPSEVKFLLTTLSVGERDKRAPVQPGGAQDQEPIDARREGSAAVVAGAPASTPISKKKPKRQS